MNVQKSFSAFKGFNSDWTCRDFQYEVGKTYTHDGKVEACQSGFHVCEHPLDVFSYYPPAQSKFAKVTLAGDTARDTDCDSKVSAAKITVGVELSLSEFVEAAVKHVFDAAKWVKGKTATGYRSAASATGDQGAASATGYRSAASATGGQGAASATGHQGAASVTGHFGAASATGDRSAASATGDRSAASATGDRSAASATGYRSAASATGRQGAASATGHQGAASATGHFGAASATGYFGAASATGREGAASATGREGAASATGYRSAAMASGYEGRVSGSEGSAIFACERNEDFDIISTCSAIVGQDGIEPHVFYVCRSGKFERVVQ